MEPVTEIEPTVSARDGGRLPLANPTSSLFRVVGTLVGLMLLLAFPEVVAELRPIDNAIQREAVAITDMFDDLKRYDTERTRETRTILSDYARSVIDDDWTAS